MKKYIIIIIYFNFLVYIHGQNGFIDLGAWDIKSETEIKLDGVWEFYPDKLLTPSDFMGLKPEYIYVPGFWNSKSKFGTLRLFVNIGDIRGILGLDIPVIYTASQVWVNGEMLCSTGRTGDNQFDSIPKFQPRQIPINTNSNNLEIVIQVSNFHHRDSGIWKSIILGDYTVLNKSKDRETAFNMFIFGALVIMGLYHATLFLLRMKDSTSLFFSLLLLSMAIRIPFVGQMLIFNVIPNMSWELTEKVSFLSFFFTILFGNMYIHSLFKREYNKLVLLSLKIITITLSVAVVALRSINYIHVLLPYQILATIVMIYNIIVLVMAIIRKREGAIIIILGLSVLVFTGLNDILYVNGFSTKGNLVPYGLFIFIFSQSFVLSRIFSKAFLRVEKLSFVFQKFIPQRFLYHVAKEGIEKIQLGNAETENVTILFTDIRDFTTLSEGMNPQEVLNFLNSYLERMTKPILLGGGTIDKFMGDSIMALFDREDNNREQEAKDAVKTAIDIFITLSIYNGHRKSCNYDPVSIGLGIHSGPVIIGTIGSEDRMDSTVLGDVVNLTSRLESLTKQYSVNAIISETSLKLVNDMDIKVRVLDNVTVKGKSKSVKIYEILDCCEEIDRINKMATLEIYNNAIQYYFDGNFSNAYNQFIECQKVYPEDTVTSVLVERCKHYIESGYTNDEWDGIYRYSVK